MFKWLLLLFITIPVTEIAIYIQLGKYIGLWPTLTLIFGTGIAGAILAKQQGFFILSKIRGELETGTVPGNHLIDGLLLLAGALFLLTPGLLTDIAGFVLLLPFTRLLFREFLKNKLRKWIQTGKINFYLHFR